MDDSNSEPFIADNNSTPSPRNRSGTAEFRERVDYFKDDEQEYDSTLAGEFKI